MRSIKPLLASMFASAFLLACSGGVDKDEPELGILPEDRTFVVFNPAIGDLPVPNDLLFAAETSVDGTMFAGEDPGNPVIVGIDALDGNSVLAPIDIEFTASLDSSQSLDAQSFVTESGLLVPNPAQNVFLLPLIYPSGDALSQAAADLDGSGIASSVEVPSFSEAISYQQALANADSSVLASLATSTVRAELLSLDGGQDNVLRITPLAPLLPKTKYLIVVTNLDDASGNPVFPNIAYETIRDPESNLAGVNPALVPLRPTIQAWEQLASGYFAFKQGVYDALALPYSAPSSNDILMTLTFTTAGTTDVLTHIAAPETFFEASLRSAYKKDAIVSLVTGEYSLDGDTSSLSDPTDIAINGLLSFLLGSEFLPDSSANPLYQVSIAEAIAGGADYTTIASADASAAFIMQSAAAQAAIQINDSGDETQGDAAPFVDIASEAIGTVLALSANNPAALFPIPQPRTSAFFRVDSAAEINPLLSAPAQVYQGEISLPQYTPSPSESGLELVTEYWQADTSIGAIIDAARGNELGTTPPSSKITYRYPFPAQQADIDVPIVATMPDEAVLTNFGITKPEAGWPVIIYIHGITQDRSESLPMANAMAFACVNSDLSGPSGLPCFATIAIDQPQHGIAADGATLAGLFDASNPNTSFSSNLPAGEPRVPSDSLTERHFSYTADASLLPSAMDYDLGFGSSGSLFINLAGFENVRDKLRQMVLDLLSLNASLPTMDVNANGLADDLDMNRVYVVGNSLGAIEGIPFVAVNNLEAVQGSVFSSLPKIQAAAMLNTGGGLPKLLANSPNLAPAIMQGLAAASDELVQGSSGLEAYLNVFQGVLDSVDPMNFAQSLADANSDTGILLTEVIGDSSRGIPSDQTIPNAADDIWGEAFSPLMLTLSNGFEIGGFPAPLAGTEPLIAQFEATASVNVSDDDGDADVLVTRFVEGSHGNIVSAGNSDVDPFSSREVFIEMITEFSIFFASNGDVDASLVSNTALVED